MRSDHPSLEEMMHVLEEVLPTKEPSRQQRIYSKEVCKQDFSKGIEIIISWLKSEHEHFKPLALSSLLYAESIKGNQDVITLLHQIIFNDTKDNLHIPAAGLLKRIGQWPDEGLSHLIVHGSSVYVKAQALQSALMLAGVSHHVAKQYAGQVESGELNPTLELVDEIAKEKQ